MPDRVGFFMCMPHFNLRALILMFLHFFHCAMAQRGGAWRNGLLVYTTVSTEEFLLTPRLIYFCLHPYPNSALPKKKIKKIFKRSNYVLSNEIRVYGACSKSIRLFVFKFFVLRKVSDFKTQ